ncbi:MAG TPA: saccharopine dehydrogenase, partial [Solirubrobacteraceae bacterium]|nr:saccharopine dehydrogenase [Solirubrobacteraceae bacterium]
DLGALFTVDAVDDSEAPIALQSFSRSSAAFSGGTFHSVVGVLARIKEAGRAHRQRRSVERHADDGQLAEGRRVEGVARRPHREPGLGWVVAAPTIDPQNVLRSARLDESYGPDFSYGHYLVTKRLSRTVGLALMIGLIATFAQLSVTRRLVLACKRPGSGPSAEKRAKSFFKVRFVADVGGLEPRRVVTEVSGGDPGYGETAKMLAESALCLAFDEAPAPGGGQWTPAIALGRPLIERLVRAGITFRVVE